MYAMAGPLGRQGGEEGLQGGEQFPSQDAAKHRHAKEGETGEINVVNFFAENALRNVRTG
jgi:hypothetical protein